MMLVTGSPLPLLALVFPLALALLAAVPVVRPRALWLLPVAPLPALALAIGGGEAVGEMPFLLLGTVLGIDGLSRPFLGFVAFLWALAGFFAAVLMAGDRKQPVFAAFWCLTLAGNLGVFMARDVATFYVSFAAVSLAAYVLVVHDGTGKVFRAGRIYLVLTVAGEFCLLAALLIGVIGAPSLLIGDVRASIAASPLRDVAVTLLILGFGLKAGLMPLHVWLPLAHPAAPVPASAVLSGAIVKAGIFGLLVFLPAGMVSWGGSLALVGIASAYLAGLLGMMQRDAKVVLAYSTVSQMGLVIALIGAGIASGDPRATFGAVALYSVHHGLAKGALFLAVGVIGATGERHRAWVMAVAALAALSIAGLPLTGGALAKATMKDAFTAPWAELAITFSAVTTALLLLRFLLLPLDKAADGSATPLLGLALPWLALVAVALVLPWLLLPGLSDLPPAYALGGAALWSASWPLALAAVLALVVLQLRPRVPDIPEGDLVIPIERGANRLLHIARSFPRPQLDPPVRRIASPRRWARIEHLEAAFGRWPVAGLLLLVFAVTIAGLLR